MRLTSSRIRLSAGPRAVRTLTSPQTNPFLQCGSSSGGFCARPGHARRHPSPRSANPEKPRPFERPLPIRSYDGELDGLRPVAVENGRSTPFARNATRIDQGREKRRQPWGVRQRPSTRTPRRGQPRPTRVLRSRISRMRRSSLPVIRTDPDQLPGRKLLDHHPA